MPLKKVFKEKPKMMKKPCIYETKFSWCQCIVRSKYFPGCQTEINGIIFFFFSILFSSIQYRALHYGRIQRNALKRCNHIGLWVMFFLKWSSLPAFPLCPAECLTLDPSSSSSSSCSSYSPQYISKCLMSVVPESDGSKAWKVSKES